MADQTSQYGSIGSLDSALHGLDDGIGNTMSTGLDKARRFEHDIEEKVMKVFGLVFRGSDIVPLMMPWVLFVVCVVPTALVTDLFLSQLTLGTCLGISIAFLYFSRGRAWQMLALACMVSCFLGYWVGGYDQAKYFTEYYFYSRSPYYRGVLPTAEPGAFKDAGFIDFSADAHVASSLGVGYISKDHWCAAPILGSISQKSIGFWAVGKNCCQMRGGFACGDTWNTTTHAGLPILDASPVATPEIPTYMTAVNMAALTYGLQVADNPILIRWDVYPEEYMSGIWSSAVSFVFVAIAMWFGLIPFFILMMNLLGLALTERVTSKVDRTWHPERLQKMVFGIRFTQPDKDFLLESDLLNGRCYWSGEVIYDYAFHVANKHLFIGILACHPAHPFSKWERAVVALINSMLIVFPVAAFSVKFGDTGVARTMVVLIGVTLPRNILKYYLINATQEDSTIEQQEGEAHSDTVRVKSLKDDALQKELIVLGTALIFACAVAGICISYIAKVVENEEGQSVTTALGKNCDGLAFAFVIELLLDMVLPFMQKGSGNPPAATGGSGWGGYFARWALERDFEESGQHAPVLSSQKKRRNPAKSKDSQLRNRKDGGSEWMQPMENVAGV